MVIASARPPRQPRRSAASCRCSLRGRAVLRRARRRSLPSLLPAAGRDALQASIAPQLTDDVIQRRLMATADSLLGQTPKLQIERGGRPARITIQTRVHGDASTCRSSSTPSSCAPRPRSRSSASARRRGRCRRRAPLPRARRDPGRRPNCWASWPSGSGSRRCWASWWPACCWAAACSGSCPPTGAPAELIHVLAELGVAAAAVRDRPGDRPARDVPGRGRLARGGVVGVVLPFVLGYLLLGATRPTPRAAGRRRDRGHLRRAPPSPPPRSASPRACSPTSGRMSTPEARDHHRRGGHRRRAGPGDPERGVRRRGRGGHHAHGRAADLRGRGRASWSWPCWSAGSSCRGCSTSSSGCGCATCSWSPRSPSRWACRAAGRPGRLGAHHRRLRGGHHSVGHQPVRHDRARGAAGGLDLHARSSSSASAPPSTSRC